MSACNSDIVRQCRIASPGSLALQPLARGSDMVQHRLAPDKKTALSQSSLFVAEQLSSAAQSRRTRLFRNKTWRCRACGTLPRPQRWPSTARPSWPRGRLQGRAPCQSGPSSLSLVAWQHLVGTRPGAPYTLNLCVASTAASHRAHPHRIWTSTAPPLPTPCAFQSSQRATMLL